MSHLCSLQGPYFKRLHFDGAAELIRMRPFCHLLCWKLRGIRAFPVAVLWLWQPAALTLL